MVKEWLQVSIKSIQVSKQYYGIHGTSHVLETTLCSYHTVYVNHIPASGAKPHNELYCNLFQMFFFHRCMEPNAYDLEKSFVAFQTAQQAGKIPIEAFEKWAVQEKLGPFLLIITALCCLYCVVFGSGRIDQNFVLEYNHGFDAMHLFILTVAKPHDTRPYRTI